MLNQQQLDCLERSEGLPLQKSRERRLAAMESLAGDLKAQKRFWKKVIIKEVNECWPWKAAVTVCGGYGVLRYAGMCLRANRISARLSFGPIPNGKHICHHCDNPPCCNPNHFFYGTDMENSKDCIRKGRARKALGLYAANVKLTPEKVFLIRSLLKESSHLKLAKRFKVHKATIGAIARGTTWKHLLPESEHTKITIERIP